MSALKIRKNIVKNVKRIVIKIGSGVLTNGKDKIDEAVIKKIVLQTSLLVKKGCEVLIVSSGSIAAGRTELGIKKILTDIPSKQAAAAVGQSHLIGYYEKYFKKEKQKTAQVLLTHDDLSNRRRYLNARNALMTLLSFHVIPVINENDMVAVHEIKFGDNDTLSALVAHLVDADLLVILSHVDGLFTGDPAKDKKAALIPLVEKITPPLQKIAGKSSSPGSVGGMYTKLKAARITSDSGISTIIVNGTIDNVITRVFKGENIGTLFLSSSDKLTGKKHWIAHTLKIKGKLTLDEGAEKAVLKRGKSLLPSGISDIAGKFDSGDAVSCVDSKGKEFCRGLVNYSSRDLKKIMGKHTSKIEEILGFKVYDEVIHRDNLVTL